MHLAAALYTIVLTLLQLEAGFMQALAALQLKYGRPTVVCVNWINPVTYVTLKCMYYTIRHTCA